MAARGPALPCRSLGIQPTLNVHERSGDADLRHPLADSHLPTHRLERPPTDHPQKECLPVLRGQFVNRARYDLEPPAPPDPA